MRYRTFAFVLAAANSIGLMISQPSAFAQQESEVVFQGPAQTIPITYLPAEFATGTDRAKLANRRTSCIEDLMPNSGSEEYRGDLQVLQSNMPMLCEDYQYAWQYARSMKTGPQKTKAIYASSKKYDIPPMILFGAIAQESSLYESGIAKDFYNFACGLAQLNVNDWCEWAVRQDIRTQKAIGWPSDAVAEFTKRNPRTNVCGTFFIVPEFVRPFYNFGLANLQAGMTSKLPLYMLEQRHVQGPGAPTFESSLPLLKSMVQENFPFRPEGNSVLEQSLRFKMSESFANHCSDPEMGIDAGALTFRLAFDMLPPEIKSAQRYRTGERRSPICPGERMNGVESNFFPVAVGWLIADAVYNAGPELLPGIIDYQKRSGISWDQFSPENLIDAINYTLTLPNSGLAPIGRVEAVGHVAGVLESIGSTLPASTTHTVRVMIPMPPSVIAGEEMPLPADQCQ